MPSADFGEEVKAVLHAVNPASAGGAVAAELLAYCHQHLTPIKCPRSIDFEAQLPRQDNGKLYKLVLREHYWHGHDKRVG